MKTLKILLLLLVPAVAFGQTKTSYKLNYDSVWIMHTLKLPGYTTGILQVNNGIVTTTSGSAVSPANPSALIGVTPINGIAPTYMRSDAAPAADTTKLQTVLNFFPKGDTRYYLQTNPNAYISRAGISGVSPIVYNSTNGQISANVASGTQAGVISSTDWTTFNNKQAALSGTGYTKFAGATASYIAAIPNTDLANSAITLNSVSTPLGGTFTVTKNNTDTTATGFQTVSNFFPKADTRYYKSTNPSNFIALTALSATSPILYNNATGVISAQTASGTQAGVLASADWTTFNNKQGAISLTTTGNSGAATFATNTLNIPNYTLAGLGGVPTTTTVAGFALSSNVTLASHTNGYGLSGSPYTGALAQTWTADTTSATGLVSKGRLSTNLTGYAPLASPALTGTPTAPTAANGTNTTQIATTAFVIANATGFANPMTTLGDIIYGGTAGAATRLAGQTTTGVYVLSQTGTGTASAAPTWYNLFGTANTWSALQTFGTNISIGGVTATGATGTGSVVFSNAPSFTSTVNFSASLKGPLLDGGSAATSTLTLQSTTGVGTSDAIIFKVGNNGATEGARFLTTGSLQMGAPVIAKSYTVATLPTATTGMIAYVTDATTPTIGSAVTGGGTAFAGVMYNGSAWDVFSK